MKRSRPLNAGASSHKFRISPSAHWVSQVPDRSVPIAGAVSCASSRLPALLGRGRCGCLHAPSGLGGERLHLHVLGEGLSVLALQTSVDAGNLGVES